VIQPVPKGAKLLAVDLQASKVPQAVNGRNDFECDMFALQPRVLIAQPVILRSQCFKTCVACLARDSEA
jgi:hypothetical protein